ncbi:MAG: PEP-CTERM sorting domain-containing protein [Pirellulales bacterium]|nr:PEP-CTERM sorting domain-containing protein [Pirellulales bacterium]
MSFAARWFLIFLFSAAMIFPCGAVFAEVTGSVGYSATEYYANPHSGEDFTSFDWFGDDLYYSTGAPNYGLGFNVYKYDGSQATSIYADSAVFVGSKVKSIGDYLYFNDYGNYSRYTCDYYKYDPNQGEAPVKVINSGVTGDDLWGLQTRTGSDLWAAGGWTTVIRYTTLDGNGDPESVPLVDLGTIGASSGPLGFDSQGNLFYAQGYVDGTSWNVYKWTASEVAAALADPISNPLDPTGHVFAAMSGVGATGMAFDDNDPLFVTKTDSSNPSKLLKVFEGGSYVELASSDGRLSELRCHDGVIYAADGDGIYQISEIPEPSSFVLLSAALVLVLFARRR